MTQEPNETFDLDNIPEDRKPVETDTALVSTPKWARTGNTIQDTYQQYTKRVWLLDYSNSMTDSISSPHHQRANQSKSDLLKEIVTENIDDKLARYGESILLRCYEFSVDVQEFTGTGFDGLKAAIRNAYAGGYDTKINRALNAGISECERNPSPVNTHQVLMVTDGMDFEAVDAADLFVARCRVSSIVVDIIWIRSKGETVDERILESLRRLCHETGGQFVEASTIEDVRRGFIASANRLCLPPASV